MPDTDLGQFILYVLPGFIAYNTYEKYNPVRKQETFTRLATSLVYGILIYAAIGYLDGAFLQHSLQDTNGSLPSIQLTLALMLGGFVLGYLQIGSHKLRTYLSRKHQCLGWLLEDSRPIWAIINSVNDEDWAVVYLKDGTIYLGWISQYSYDPDSEQQDFLLSEAKRVNDQLKPEWHVTGKGVYLTTDSIHKIEYLSS